MSTETEVQTGWYGLSSTDPSFVDEIMKMQGEKKILNCIQCGVCSGSCPARFAMDYSPMQIIKLAQLGMKDTLFKSNTIWICATCYGCTERCPRGIDIGGVMTKLRNLAIKAGFTRTLFEAQGNIIIKHGRIWSEQEFVNELRTDAGLTPITTITPEELEKLVQRTNAKELLKVKEKK